MSNPLAIGAVTAVLQNVIENGMLQQDIATILGGRPELTVLSPSIESNNGTPRDRLNLFLFQTSINSGWRNVGMPIRNGDGDRVNNSPLALDLHYLLTAYSQEAMHAEIMLGYAMQILHDTSFLPREKIRSVLREFASSSQPAFRALTRADIADQVELIKVTPQQMSSEEMSKLWSALQTPYRPTAAYQISVVLIDRPRSVKSALPVLERRLFALPFQAIVLNELQPQIITAGSTLTVRGEHLQAEQVRVMVGGVTITPTPAQISDRELQIPIPTTLQAGINTVQVAHLLDFGPPSGLHRGFESNVLPFVLRPRIVSAEIVPTSDSNRVQVQLTVEPAIAPTQTVTLLLNQQDSEKPAAYSAVADRRTAQVSQITIPVNHVRPGRYLVRIQVDGAESLPEIDANHLFSGEPAISVP